MEIGFGSASLWDSFETTMRLADVFDVRVLAARGNGTTGLAIVADYGKVLSGPSVHLRKLISEKTGVPMQHIGIFGTQNHSAPGPVKNEAKRDSAFVAAAEQALSRLQPARMAHVTVHPNPPLNHRRRIRLEGVGTFTCWYGHRDLGNGQADVSHMIKKSLANFAAGEWEQVRSHVPKYEGEYEAPQTPIPVPTPLIPRPAFDDALQGLFFQSMEGKPIGSLIRFATHPAAANPKPRDFGSGDFPAYVRRRAEAKFDGVGMYMTGPCGDSCPILPRKSLELAERIGTSVADEALAALNSAKWVEGGTVAVDTPAVSLPVRENYPKTMDEAKAELEAKRGQFRQLASSGAALSELKKLSDQIESLGYVVRETHAKWSERPLEEHAGTLFDQTLFVMRLGDCAIAGLPGEPFNAYSARLRRETIGEKLIVAEQCNGGLGYIPTADEFQHGSYEGAATMFDERVEELLIHGIKTGMMRVGFK